MRINQFVAQATGISRRKADKLVQLGFITVNGERAETGTQVTDGDHVEQNGKPLVIQTTQTIILHKPVGYVCSRDGQGSPTVYELLPTELRHLKTVGRLDKDSSGLLVLTNDGDLANKLTHPSFKKQKVYEIQLNRDLSPTDFTTITKQGVNLEDGPSKLQLDYMNNRDDSWRVTMHEGRNRQIRRTFEALGYRVKKLRRIQFGSYELGNLVLGKFRVE